MAVPVAGTSMARSGVALASDTLKVRVLEASVSTEPSRVDVAVAWAVTVTAPAR
jgi:hypothetical protein